MEAQKKKVDFLDISPYVRYAHHLPDANKDNHLLPWRYIYDYEFLYISDGCMQVLTEEDSYTLEANEIHIMPPLVWHRRLIPDGKFCNYYSVHFDFISLGQENDFSAEEVYISKCNTNWRIAPIDEKLVRRPLYVLGNIELPSKMLIHDPIAYTELLDNIIRVRKEKSFAYEIDLKCSMLMLLKQILYDMRFHIVGKVEDKDGKMSVIIQYILDKYQESINFESICRMYGYSYSNFRKLFKQQTGKSPNEFLIDVRMDKAVEFLHSQKYTVAEVAELVGYQDCSYFSRLFRQKKGSSPSSFLHKIRKD